MPTAETHLPLGYAPEEETRLAEAAETVQRYLAAMEARDLEAAKDMLGDGFRMVFPGTPPMTALSDLIDWAKGRYRFVGKTTDAVETFRSGDLAVVYVRGTLHGEWPDGRAFDGIRFIDRFEVSAGKITRQDVWNDMGEVRGT